ncbi:hypothetical protein ACLQ2E_17925 [Streptomyces lavendulocolor]
MKTVIVLLGIAAAAAALVAGALALAGLRKQAVEASKPSTWGDIEQIRQLALAVDGRTRWVAWLTVINAVLSLLIAAAALTD